MVTSSPAQTPRPTVGAGRFATRARTHTRADENIDVSAHICMVFSGRCVSSDGVRHHCWPGWSSSAQEGRALKHVWLQCAFHLKDGCNIVSAEVRAHYGTVCVWRGSFKLVSDDSFWGGGVSAASHRFCMESICDMDDVSVA